MSEKRYYWLKLKEDYFNSPKIKKLRKIAGGDTYTIIYLKMQLLSVSNKGIISFEGIESTFEEELALKLDEQTEDVQMTLAYLQAQNLIERNENDYLLSEVCKNIGSESDSAERVRKFRERENIKMLQCNASVTDVLQNSISISNSMSKSNMKETAVFDYWNSKEIIKHKELTQPILKQIQKTLKEYSIEDIKKYIDRYNTVIKDKSYYFDTKWSLTEFLKQRNAMCDFKDDGSKWVNYTNKHTKENKNKSNYTEHRDYSGTDLNSMFDDLENVEL